MSELSSIGNVAYNISLGAKGANHSFPNSNAKNTAETILTLLEKNTNLIFNLPHFL